MPTPSWPLCRPRGPFCEFEDADVEQSIPDRFHHIAAVHGSSPAVTAGGRALTYAELDDWSSRVASAIQAAGRSDRRPVLVVAGQTLFMPAAVLGVLKAGRIYAPQHPGVGAEVLREVDRQCGRPLLVTDKLCLDRVVAVLGSDREILNVDSLPAGLPSWSRPNLDADQPATLYFTSGSTGAPRGVVDSHRNLLNNVKRYTNSLAIGPSDRLSLVQSCGFSGAISSLFSALLNGAAVFPFDLSAHSSRQLAEWVRHERLTMFHSVPAVFEQLCEAGGGFPELKVIRLEGDQALPDHARLFVDNCEADCLLVNGPGATETGLVRQFPMTTRCSMQSVLPLGFAVREVDVAVVDEEGREADPGEVGEIVVSSPFLALGYWKGAGSDFEPIAAAGPYRTGDLGRLEADGCLYYEGRVANEVRIRGQRVDVTAVEAALREIDGVAAAVVGAGPRLVAYLTTETGAARMPVERLRRRLVEQLPPHALPSRFVYLESLPLDSNRKVARRLLPVPAGERPELETAFRAPVSPVEIRLTGLFSSLLEVEPVGVDGSFFDLGGDSLLATRLASRILQEWGVALSVRELLDEPTAAGLARRIRTAE